ncbi:hypothetical protein JCM16814_26680 [Desulfobaculum senezii]
MSVWLVGRSGAVVNGRSAGGGACVDIGARCGGAALMKRGAALTGVMGRAGVTAGPWGGKVGGRFLW